MKVLAENGSDIFNKDSKGQNVLHIAASMNYTNIIKMLIKSGFPLDEVTDRGFTAIAMAAKHGHL